MLKILKLRIFSTHFQKDVFSVSFLFQPDLLNFKKGWMVKLDEQGQVLLTNILLTDHLHLSV